MNLFELFVKIGVDDQASGKLSKLSSSLGNGLKKAAKIGTAAVGVAAAGITALTTSAIKNYAEYEQLVGGVETLFKDSADKVQEYASNAFRTAGLSANEYMATVTSFSASLLQSLGGDTDKAAEYANQALTDMSDNANKMGTSMELIQNAYQGFAKQNYTMLDNLKLGYGGTQAEMKRLVKDAEKLNKSFKATRDKNGELVLSFADVVEAIHIVQDEMGITGTTAKEAASTISGSVQSVKASWKNLVTGIANENSNFDQLMDDFVKSVEIAGKNILPRVTKALEGAAKLITKLAPTIAKELPKLMKAILPDLAKATANLIISIAEEIPSMLGALLDAANSVADAIGEAFAKKIPQLSFVFENLRSVIWAVVGGLVAYKAAMMITGTISAVTAAIKLATTAQAGLNAAMAANPIGLVITAIGALIGWLASEEKAIKGVEEAQKDLNEARQHYIDMDLAFVDAMKNVEDTSKKLIELETKLGTTGESLYNSVEEGVMTYSKMTVEQKELYYAYLKNKQAEERLEDATKDLSDAKEQETRAFWDNELAIAAQSGSYQEYGEAVVKAFEDGEISAEQAREALGKAMSDMSYSAMQTFLKDVPASIREGLSPKQYASTWELIERDFNHEIEDLIFIISNFNTIAKNVFSEVISFLGKEIEAEANSYALFFEKIKTKLNDFWEEIKGRFKFEEAVQWGKDLIDNFISGIKQRWDQLVNTLAQTAQKVRDYLGFSEPKKGPLSNFHTYAPDMMDLFAQGIRENEDVVTDQIEKSFDFGERTMKFGSEYAKSAGGIYGGTSVGNITINIDGARYEDEQTLAEAVAEAIQGMTDRRAAVYA